MKEFEERKRQLNDKLKDDMLILNDKQKIEINELRKDFDKV